MQKSTIGFVGGGRIVSIFLGGWKRAGVMPADLVVSEPNPEVLAALRAACPELRPGTVAQAGAQDLVFLAVHPPLFKDVLPAVRPVLKPNAVVVSLAPKLTTGKIAEMLGGFGRVARVIPNAPSLVGAGYNPVAFGQSLPPSGRQLVIGVLRPLGECPEVAEAKLEAYAILTAMGPTYFWHQFYELLALSQGFGLTPAEAQAGLSRMVAGAVATIIQSDLGPEQVKDLIPVKPLADIEAVVAEAYRQKLTAVMERIKP